MRFTTKGIRGNIDLRGTGWQFKRILKLWANFQNFVFGQKLKQNVLLSFGDDSMAVLQALDECILFNLNFLATTSFISQVKAGTK